MGARINRRSLLGGGAAAVAAVTGGMAMATQAKGETIATQSMTLEGHFAAWKRARWQLNNSPADLSDAAEASLWSTIDASEMAILDGHETGARIAAMRLWIALDHSTNTIDDTNACAAENLAAFVRTESERDWDQRMVIAALRAVSIEGGR